MQLIAANGGTIRFSHLAMLVKEAFILQELTSLFGRGGVFRLHALHGRKHLFQLFLAHAGQVPLQPPKSAAKLRCGIMRPR